jgi:NitT/TauT family transport system substrate-binding protein
MDMSAIRYVLAAVAACLLLAQPAQGEPIRIRVSTNNFIDSAPFEAAKAKGYFADEGIEVDTTVAVGGAVGLPALAAGQVQFAASNIISIVLGVHNGLPFQIVAAGDTTNAAPPDLAGLAVKPGSDVKTGKDLEGKRLAVNTRNNIIWLFARAWVDATGGQADKVAYIEVPFPQMVDAIRQGRVDAGFIVEPFLSDGVQSATVAVVAWPYSAVQKSIPISQFVSTKSYIEQNPDVVARFMRAYERGTDWINQNKGSDEWVALISSYTRISPDNVRRAATPAFVKTVDPANLENVVALMRRHGLLQADDKIDAKGLIHPAILAK